ASRTGEKKIGGLRQGAGRRGWDVVEVYSDAGISGAKGRNGRPGLDSMLKDASRRRFVIGWEWGTDAWGRSLFACQTPSTTSKHAAWICIWISRPSTRRRLWASSFSRSPARSLSLSAQ